MTPLDKLLLELLRDPRWGTIRGMPHLQARSIIGGYASRIEGDVMKGFIKFLEEQK